MNAIQYPHMVDRESVTKSGITILQVSRTGVRLTTSDKKTTDISWRDLIAAATQDAPDLRPFYAALHAEAANRLAMLPRKEQGLVVDVATRTSGATHEVVVTDVSGRYRRDLMRSDEGGSHPHFHLAEIEAHAIRARLAI